MAENGAVRTIRIRGIPEGLDAMASKLKAVEGAYAGLARQSDTVAVSTERVEKRQLSAKAAYDRLQRSLDDQFRLEEKMWRVQRDLQRASDQGLVSEQRRMQLLDLARQRYSASSAAVTGYSHAIGKTAVSANDNLARSTGLARHELVNFSRQIQDVATMAAMGQSPFAILSSQGAQLVDIFTTTQGSMRGIVSQFAGGAARFATSGAGMATGAGALLLAATASAMSYAAAQREVENALRGVGAASGASLAGINKFAMAEAAAGKISTASAREIASAFASTGRVDPTKLPGLGSFAKEYSAFTGMGMDDATKELASAFADPSKGAEMLAGKIGGLNSAALRWIEAQQAAGNMLGAQNTLMATFAQQVDGATERTGAFARAWDAVKRSVSDADTALGRALNGPTDAERLASLQQQRDRLQQSPGLGVANQLRQLEAQIRPLEALVELERQRAAIDQRTAKAGNASLAASTIADQINPFRKQLEELLSLQSKLEEAMRLNPRAGGYDEWAKALDRVQGARSTLLPSMERERQSHELNMRAISARTLQERAAIDVAREGLRLSGEKVSAAEREIAMQRKAAEVQAQANREASDALRTSRDQLALSGLRPGERFRVEQEQARRDNIERFGGGAAAAGGTGGAVGLEAAFAATLKKMMAEIPGLSITSGFRTYEQQAKLYAEKPGWAARPGTSNHERGIAADLAYKGSGQLPGWLREKLAAEYGVSFPLANRAVRPEPWHVEPNGGSGRTATAGASSGAASEIYSNAFAGRERDLRLSVIGAGEDALAQQARALETQRAAFGRSTEEVARMNAQQDLFNKLIAAGGADLAGKFTPDIERLAAKTGELARQTEEYNRMAEAMRDVRDIGASTFKGIISDLRQGKNGTEIFANALNRLADSALNSLSNVLFGVSGGNSFGLLGKFLGFADGGYTGSGSKYQPAGIVHAGEYVFSQASVNRLGVGTLDHMHRSSLRGYADGGMVTPAPQPYSHQPVSAANGNKPQKVKIAVDVTGATGNAEIQRMVAAGVTQGMNQVRSEVPGIMFDVNRRAGS